MSEQTVFLKDQETLVAFAGNIAPLLAQGCVVYLQGTLGAGKTTFSRGVLQGLGHQGAVKSPTYTLVEPYHIGEHKVYHFDLYRLGHPEELEYLGIRDYLEENALWLVEWPSKGEGFIPAADIVIQIEPNNTGRDLLMIAQTEVGKKILAQVK